MPRKFAEVDHELLRQYIIPSLRCMAEKLRTDDSWWGKPKPGRAKTAELAADWLEELLALEAEHRSPPVDGDEWLAAMEREADEMHAASARARELTDRSYRCPECGMEIEAGSKVAAGVRGIIHAECPDLVGAAS